MYTVCEERDYSIKQQIESTRSEMNRLANELGRSHPKVMRCSQQLDRLLLEYYNVTRTR